MILLNVYCLNFKKEKIFYEMLIYLFYKIFTEKTINKVHNIRCLKVYFILLLSEK